MQIQQGRNYETRRCSGVPDGAQRSFWTHVCGSLEDGARVPKLRVPSDHWQKDSDGVTRQRRCAGTRSCSGKLWPSTRESSSTPRTCHVPDVDYRAYTKPVQNVSCVCPTCLRTTMCPERRHFFLFEFSPKILTTRRRERPGLSEASNVAILWAVKRSSPVDPTWDAVRRGVPRLSGGQSG